MKMREDLRQLNTKGEVPSGTSPFAFRCSRLRARAGAHRILRCESSAAIHSSTIDPMTAVTRLPSVPTGTSPMSEKSHPPSTPPTSPTIRLTSSPELPPLTMRLAIHPAASPRSRYQMKYILFRFVFTERLLQNPFPNGNRPSSGA